MNNNSINEYFDSFKYFTNYQRGVVISEQAAVNPATPDKNIVKDALKIAKDTAKEYRQKARIDNRTKRRQERSDRKTCDTLRRGINVVTAEDKDSLSQLCPVLYDCIADGNIEKTFQFPACEAYKTQAASQTEKTGAKVEQTGLTPERTVETECIKRYEWFKPDKYGIWEQDKITYKGKNLSGDTIVFTYSPTGGKMGTVQNTKTNVKKLWSCPTAPQQPKTEPQQEVPIEKPTAQQQKLGLA